MKSTETFEYSGTIELINTENYLKKYNTWIAKLLIMPLQCKGWSSQKTISSGKITHVMDFGAGIGTISKITKKLRPDFYLHAVEPDENLHNFNPKTSQMYQSLADIPEKLQMDFVFSSNVLEHIPDDVSAIKNIAKKMKKGATFSIYVPAMKLLWSPMDDHVEHHRRYTFQTLSEAICSAGLKPIKIKYVDSSGALLTLFYKIINKFRRQTKNYTRPSVTALNIYDKLICPLNNLTDILFGHKFGKNLIAYCIKE